MAGPSFLADASAFSTEAVIRARRVLTVDFFAESSFESTSARTFPADAMTVAIAVRNFAFVVSQLTFFAFPSGVALTFSVYIVADTISISVAAVRT